MSDGPTNHLRSPRADEMSVVVGDGRPMNEDAVAVLTKAQRNGCGSMDGASERLGILKTIGRYFGLRGTVERLESMEKQDETIGDATAAEASPSPNDAPPPAIDATAASGDLAKALERIDALEKSNKALEDRLAKGGERSAFRSRLPDGMRESYDKMTGDEQDALRQRFGKASDADESDGVSKAMDDLLQKQRDTEEKLEKMRDETEVAKTLDEFRSIEKGLGEPDRFARSVVALRKASPEAVKVLLEAYKALHAQADTAELFKTSGHRGGDSQGSAEAKIDAAAKAIQKADGITYHAAYAQALERNPDLYKEYRSQAG